MAKVFRLYDGGADTYTGWNGSPAFPYNETARKSIKDPNGASAKHEITSIPSPFARIDLVKTAFREVCRMANQDLGTLDGNTIYHKMVSDSFDVGEIFFRIDNLSDKVEIITCDVRQMMNDLAGDGIAEHTIVADALDKYFKSDAKSYNFNLLQNFYLLNYKNGPDELNIIGATSPATIFFCGANNLSYVDDIFFANEDRPFDDDFQPLYKRDKDYVKAIWTLRKTIPNFASLFPEVDDYLNLTYRAISDLAFKGELQSLTSTYATNFDRINILVGQQNNLVEVLGTPLFKRKGAMPTGNSEFTIAATRAGITTLPLVLPTESGNQYANLNYVSGPWGSSYSAPYTDALPVDQRKLPCEGSRFPYLTISDFLEDNLTKVDHALDKAHYFDGNAEGVEGRLSYLLPIKPLYFKYFTVDDLTSLMLDGRRAIEMETLAGGSVRVTLRIPIIGNAQVQYIEYQRTYYAERHAEISATKNTGGIKLHSFTGMVMPSVKFSTESQAIYTVACVTPFSAKTTLEFYKGGEIIRDIPRDCRNTTRGMGDYKADTYTLEKTNFEAIRVVAPDGVTGLLVPIFAEHQNIDNYDFAVDLGTSNTHIEYMKHGNQGDSKPLDHTDQDNVASRFFVPSFRELEGKLLQWGLERENDLLEADFVPAALGADSDFHFPARTVLSYAKTTDWTKTQRVFGMVNFNLTYNKRVELTYNATPMVNIKWSSENNAEAAMQAYINNLMMLIRNKVVACNGNLQNTRITWFFPNSMSIYRRNLLAQAWNQAYGHYFNPSGSTNQISESVAPIKYYFDLKNNATDLVNVDIGGGTTDIAFSSGGTVKYITSFKFAGNSLFEDPISSINRNNGIIDSFQDDIFNLLQNAAAGAPDNQKLRDLLTIFKSNKGQPANMASFLFSLKDNSAVADLDSQQIDFSKILQRDRKFKIVFVLFYTAIVYHIAQIVRVKGMKAPRYIAFSGNGSKILSIVTSDAKVLGQYTKIVFERVLGMKIEQRLEILGLQKDANPKESTCKGGLLAQDASDNPDTLVLRDSSGAIAAEADTYASIDDDFKQMVVDSVKEFFNFALEEVPKAIRLDDYFGVERKSLELAREECKNDLETFLERGITISEKESGERDKRIEDSLSFYPIKGVLDAISTRIKEEL